MNLNWDTPEKKRMIEAVLAVATPAEARSFLRDLMTRKEIEEFARRLEAAELLLKETPYSVIIEKTGLSSTTVARVAKSLHGPEGGYMTILHRLHTRKKGTSSG